LTAPLDAAATRGDAPCAHHEEADARLEQLVERKAVTLIFGVESGERAVQLIDELSHLRRRRVHALDGDGHVQLLSPRSRGCGRGAIKAYCRNDFTLTRTRSFR
jgi:hypothetical protein